MHDVVRAMAFMQFGSGYNVVVISAAVLVWDSEGELFTWTTDVLDGSVFLGLVVGTLALGNYADVTGRLAAQRLSCWLAVAGCALSACAYPEHGRYVEIACFRFVLGVGAGGGAPIAAAYTYEFLRAEARAAGDGPAAKSGGAPARAAGSMDLYNFVGQMVAYLVAAAILATSMPFGVRWRLLLGLGAAPFLVSLFLTRNADESPAFGALEPARRRPTRAGGFLATLQSRDPKGYGKLVDLVVVLFCFQLVSYGMLLLQPEIVQEALPDTSSDKDVLLILAGLSFVGICAVLASLPFLQQRGALPSLEASLIFAALAAWAFALGLGLTSSSPALLVLCFVSRFAVNAPASAAFAASTILFPTEVRATANGVVVAAGKLGGLVGTLCFEYVAVATGNAALLAICATFLVIGAAFTHKLAGDADLFADDLDAPDGDVETKRLRPGERLLV